MAKRLIEIVLPEGRGDDVAELLYEQHLDHYWRDSIGDNQIRISILLPTSEVEAVFDILEPYLATLPGASAVLLNVEASIPREKKKEPESGEDDGEEQEQEKSSGRISRHELYNDIAANCGINATYLIMVALSAVIAAIGLARDDVAIIIGAMVLAPLLTPNVAVALANSLGDTELAVKGVKTAAVGLGLALAIAVLIGLVFPVDSTIPAIAARTQLHWSDLVLALASGAAGVLAFTSGGQLSLIGVMVAVALMPPLVTGGLLFGSGHVSLGLKALELTCANVICVNLAGIITFSLQGIHPATWWEKSQAKRAKKKALWTWTILLILLALILL
ncbi:MAG: TIGR00341 family protein [Thermodesulfobacteriota bacterium]